MATLSCGCEPDLSGFGYCDKCVTALRAKIWREMPEDKKRFDRYVSPAQSRALDNAQELADAGREPEGCCSCHINPPCSYCMRKGEDDNEQA